MSKKEKHYFQESFMGVSVKCDADYPSLIKIIEALYVMVYGCTKAYTRQRGYHVRLRFTEKMDSRKFSARLSTFFKRKSKYIPLRLTVVECDEDEEGLHYHFAIILNDGLDRKSSLQHFMGQLMAGGFLADYKVIAPKIDPYGHHLRSLEERDSFYNWMSYLAKVETKPAKGQVLSSCRIITNALKEWELAGKPDLRKQLFDQNPKERVATVDVFEIMQLIDVPPINLTPHTPPSGFCGAI